MFIPHSFKHILLSLSLASYALVAQSSERQVKRPRLAPKAREATASRASQSKQVPTLALEAGEATASRDNQSKQTPIIALSVNLIRTYKKINETYYEKKREKAAKTSLQDLQAGMLLQERYKLQKLLGEGVSSQVWLARDLKEPKDVAIKIFSPSWPVKSIKKEFDCLVKVQ